MTARTLVAGASVACGCLAPLLVSSAAHGQVPNESRVAGMRLDTGDFAPRRQFLAHHDTPHLCIAAVRNTEWVERRTYADQIAAIRQHEAPLTDTLPSGAKAVARECLAQFTGRNVATYDLSDLLRLALLAGQDTLARTVAERLAAAQPTPAAHDAMLVRIDSVYLTARPARPAGGAWLLGRIAQAGEQREQTRLLLMRQLLQFWSDVYDPSQMQHWADQIITVVHGMSRRALVGGDWAVVEAYRARAKVAYVLQIDSLASLAEQARQTWRSIPRDTLSGGLPWNPTDASVADIQRILEPMDMGPGVAAGESYPPLTAKYWFPAPPAWATPTTPGPATLVVTPEFPCFTGDNELLSRPTELCMPTYERIRRLAAQYDPHELRIVVATGTQGNAIRSLPLSHDKEAETLRWYILDDLKLPVTLAVVERSVFQFPAPDLRRWPTPACDESMASFFGNDTSVAACQYLSKPLVLLGQHGELIYAGAPGPFFNILLERTVGTAAAATGGREEH